MRSVGFTSHHLYAYVLVGYKNDTPAEAEKRIIETWKAGMFPYVMLYRNEQGNDPAYEWAQFKKGWRKFEITRAKLKGIKQSHEEDSR